MDADRSRPLVPTPAGPAPGVGFLSWNAGHGASLVHLEPLELVIVAPAAAIQRPTGHTFCGKHIPDRPVWTDRRSSMALKLTDLCRECLAAFAKDAHVRD
jgi:hypothetical protein